MASDEFFRDPRIAVTIIALVLLVTYTFLAYSVKKLPKPKITKEMLALLSFVVISYVLWEKVYSYYRYVVIIEFLSLLVITAIIWSIVHSTKFAALLSLVVIIPIIFMTSPMNYGHITWQSSWFGVKLPINFIKSGSTVLMTGNEHQSFLLPYFPKNITFIRTQGNIYEPQPPVFPETTAYRQLVMSAIASGKAKDGQLFALETSDNISLASAALKEFNFKVISCYPVYTYESQYLEKNNNYYQLCSIRND